MMMAKMQTAHTDSKRNNWIRTMRMSTDWVWEFVVGHPSEYVLNNFITYTAPELAERLEGIDLNDSNAVWERLTDAERQEFDKIVHSQDVSDLLEIRDPWWTQPETATKPPGKPLIEDISAAGDDKPTTSKTQSQRTEIPPIFARIVAFERLSSKPPADCVPHNVANVLAAYALTYRTFNGHHADDALEASAYMLNICENLRDSRNFETYAQAVENVQKYCSPEDGGWVDSDVAEIMRGPRHAKGADAYTLAALSDVHRMLSVAKKQIAVNVVEPSTTKTPEGDDKCSDGAAGGQPAVGSFAHRYPDPDVADMGMLTRSQLSAHAKKVEYYLAYVKQFQ